MDGHLGRGTVDEPSGDSGNHMAGAHCFDDEYIGHDGEDVVVRRKRREPVNCEIVNPDDEDRKING